jgi:hypothetical protein
MFIVLRKARKWNLSIEELFDTMVVPILLYGAEVWGFENCNIIENFQMQFNNKIGTTIVSNSSSIDKFHFLAFLKTMNMAFLACCTRCAFASLKEPLHENIKPRY